MLLKNVRTLFLTLLIILGCGLSAGPAAFAQERDWQPQRTWVFIVGTLKWKHSDVFNSFPQKNRRDAQLVDFFLSRCELGRRSMGFHRTARG